jgi:EAL domain-containing protein (putative c-di-GMP-specific phosphodiesterase class I)
MRQPVTIEGSEISATVSIGIAIGHQQYQRPEEILRDADTAMYVAKSEGRSRAVLFDASMKSAARRTSDPAADLRLAVTRGELRIAYQPIVRLSDRRLVGFESLVRWQHPLHGLLMPSRFIPAAETSDTILAIDRWMLEAGCRQMAEWLAAGADPRSQISINVSSREFSCEGLLDDLRSVLADSELPPANLRLEITETVVVDRSAKANALFARIREIGVALDIDDFGTGFSTLGALQHIAVDALKIDRSFVAGMYSPIGSSLVQTVIYLAHKLGLLVVAEGIETAEQAALLVEFGCDCGQGFFLSPPLDAPGAGRLLDCEMLPSAS